MSAPTDPGAPLDGAFGDDFWSAVRARARQLPTSRGPAPSSRRLDGEPVQIRFHDRRQLISLRRGRPDDEGRPGRSLTQRQVATRIGISHGHYGDLESGRRHPSLAVAQRLAALLEVPLDALCDVRPVEAPGATAATPDDMQVSGRRR